MDSHNDSRVTVQEVQMLLGEKDVQIYGLQRQLDAALKRIAELEKPAEQTPQ